MSNKFKFSMELNDIVPEKKGDDAVIALTSSEDAVKAYKATLELSRKIKDKKMSPTFRKNVNYLVYSALAAEIDKIVEKERKKCEKKIKNLRKWAEDSYSEIYALTPYMTGHLRESIEFYGTGPLDLDVGINPVLLDRSEQLPILHEWYDNSHKIGDLVEVGGYSDANRLNYLQWVTEHARRQNWWDKAAPHKVLKGFTVGPNSKWEKIKKRNAERYKIEYQYTSQPAEAEPDLLAVANNYLDGLDDSIISIDEIPF